MRRKELKILAFILGWVLLPDVSVVASEGDGRNVEPNLDLRHEWAQTDTMKQQDEDRKISSEQSQGKKHHKKAHDEDQD